MGRFFVSPESVRLDLPRCGSWVEVRRELNRAEHDKVIGAGLAGFRRDNSGETPENDFRVDTAAINLVKLETWIVDWGFSDEVPTRNEDGDTVMAEKSVPVSKHAIRNLSVDVSDEILEAIERHQERLEQEKKVKHTTGGLRAT